MSELICCEIRCIPNSIHQPSHHKCQQRCWEPISHGSNESQNHQKHIQTVRMHENRKKRPIVVIFLDLSNSTAAFISFSTHHFHRHTKQIKLTASKRLNVSTSMSVCALTTKSVECHVISSKNSTVIITFFFNNFVRHIKKNSYKERGTLILWGQANNVLNYKERDRRVVNCEIERWYNEVRTGLF